MIMHEKKQNDGQTQQKQGCLALGETSETAYNVVISQNKQVPSAEHQKGCMALWQVPSATWYNRDTMWHARPCFDKIERWQVVF
jgi:hypothetical protein